MFAAVVSLGTAGFVLIEHWRPLDALWMVVITLTTIGFGEIHPLSDAGRIFAIGVILAGVSVGTYAMGALTQMIVEGQLQAIFDARRRRKEMQVLKDHFIVIGFGRLGQAVAEELLDSGVQVCVVERDPAKAALAESLHRFPVVNGDGASDEVLTQAGLDRAKGVAVAVDNSAQAIYVTLSVRQLNPGLTVVTRVDDVHESLKARRAGASAIVSPYRMGGWRIAHELIRPHATSFLDTLSLAAYASVQLEEFTIADGSRMVGRTLGNLRIGQTTGALVVAIRRNDGQIEPAPKAEAILASGDTLIVIGSPESVARLRDLTHPGG